MFIKGVFMVFSKMVEEVRGKLQLTQKELADILGVGYHTVNRWEKGHHEPTFLARRKFDDLCKKYGIEFDRDD